MTTPKLLIQLNTFLAKVFPVNYEKYLQTERWRRKADAAKERALWQCQGCGRPRFVIALTVHHRTYTRLGWEIPEDLTVFCPDCHYVITIVKRKVYNVT